jgi:dihydropteroate synthase
VDRAAGSAAAAMIAVQKGAAIVRVHDVAATRDALLVWEGVARGTKPARNEAKPFGSQRFEDD